MVLLPFNLVQNEVWAGVCVYLLILSLFFRIYLHAFVFNLPTVFLVCSIFLPQAFSACFSIKLPILGLFFRFACFRKKLFVFLFPC